MLVEQIASIENPVDRAEAYLKNGTAVEWLRSKGVSDSVIEQAQQRAAGAVVPVDSGVTAEAQAAALLPTVTFADRAKVALPYGIPVVPALPRQKATIIGSKEATTDLATIEKWNQAEPNYNSCLVAQAKIGGIWILDCDSPEVKQQIEKDTGKKLPDTFAVSSSSAGHRYFRQNEESLRRLRNFSVHRGDKEFFSVRWDNMYCIGPLSIHPSGAIYKIVRDVEPVEAPSWLIAWLVAQMPEVSITANDDGEEPILQGTRDNVLMSLAGRFRQVMKADEDQLFDYLSSVNEKRCQPPMLDTDIRRIAHSAASYPIKNNSLPLTSAGKTETEIIAQSQAAQQPEEPEDNRLVMTQDEIDAEYEKPYPIIRLSERGGPTWDDDIMYGIAGQIIRKASEYNESHPAGMYLDLLVALGNLFGRTAYFNVNSTAHYTNEFLARVGVSSRSRKGSGRDSMNQLLEMLDQPWYTDRVLSGFSSGQGIINELRDASNQKRMTKGVFRDIVVPGVTDKRLFVREDELARVFQAAAKTDSIADVVLRNGWDGKPINSIVRGKDATGISNSLRCSEPHLSVSGDTTKAELFKKMPDGWDENGNGNRFLYCYVYRTKLCPQGGPQIDWTEEVNYLIRVIGFVRAGDMIGGGPIYVPLTKAAGKMWNRMYLDLESNRPAGLAGKMTDRGPAHVRRLGLILALLDMKDEVDSCHLQAARRIWDYCQESAEYIFTGMTRDQRRIVKFVEQHPNTTATDIHKDVFKWHRAIGWVRAQIEELACGHSLIVNGDKLTSTNRALAA